MVEQGGEVVGWCWGYHLVRPDGRSKVYLHELEVIPAARRKGHGRRLLDEMLSLARRHGAEKLFLITEHSNQPARQLYESYRALVLDDGGSIVHWWQTDQPTVG